MAENKKYYCPKCRDKMRWTGNVSQNLKGTCVCSLLYEYKCENLRCRYKEKYDSLDSAGAKVYMEHLYGTGGDGN